MKRLKSDNGGEYVATHLQNYLQQQGIVHDTIPPYHYELNGVAERFNRMVIQIARSMINTDDLLFLWAEAVRTTAFLMNLSTT